MGRTHDPPHTHVTRRKPNIPLRPRLGVHCVWARTACPACRPFSNPSWEGAGSSPSGHGGLAAGLLALTTGAWPGDSFQLPGGLPLFGDGAVAESGSLVPLTQVSVLLVVRGAASVNLLKFLMWPESSASRVLEGWMGSAPLPSATS